MFEIFGRRTLLWMILTKRRDESMRFEVTEELSIDVPLTSRTTRLACDSRQFVIQNSLSRHDFNCSSASQLFDPTAIHSTGAYASRVPYHKPEQVSTVGWMRPTDDMGNEACRRTNCTPFGTGFRQIFRRVGRSRCDFHVGGCIALLRSICLHPKRPGVQRRNALLTRYENRPTETRSD